jgi:hypothetical protein
MRSSSCDLSNTRPNVRQQLRQQLSNTFPTVTRKSSQETSRRLSQLSTHSVDIMGAKDKLARPSLAVGINASAKSSSSTVNSVGQPRRSSAMPEGQMIDVEAAINLLQELKKNASPEELVALHRALLPTREVETVSSPVILEEDSEPGATFFKTWSTRRASRLPPGLATRGGIGEDVLRKPSEIAAAAAKRKAKPAELKTKRSQRQLVPFVGDSAALEIVDTNIPRDLSRAPTPPEFAYGQTGAYAPGTLRVMNGAASPEPGMLLEQLKPDVYDMTTKPCASLDFRPGRASLDHPGRKSIDDMSVRERILYSARDRVQNDAGPSSAHLVSLSSETQRTLLDIVSHVHDQDSERESPSPVPSPMSIILPLRSGKRTSIASQDNASDSEIAESPREVKPHVNDFISRLSTVYGEDQDADDGHGTPEDALSKLVGVSKAEVPRGPRPSRSRSIKTDRPAPVLHKDSGYSSDLPYELPRRLSEYTQQRDERLPALTPSRESFSTSVLQLTVRPATNDDAASLYNFHEFLTSPTALSEESAATPKTPTSGKMPRLMALRTKSAKRISLPIIGSIAPQLSSDSTVALASTQSVPAKAERPSLEASRSQKKLQKAMPQHLKEKMVLRRGSVEHAALTGLKESPTPPIPDTVNKAFGSVILGYSHYCRIHANYLAVSRSLSKAYPGGFSVPLFG